MKGTINRKNQVRNIQRRNFATDEIAQAIYVVNRRAKMVPDASMLYALKHEAIKKLVSEQRATRLCVHRFKRVHHFHSIKDPKIDVNTIFTLVSCGEYIFHYPANQQDIKDLLFQRRIIGIRNPRSEMSYATAKRLLIGYLED